MDFGSMSVLRRDYLPADLRRESPASGSMASSACRPAERLRKRIGCSLSRTKRLHPWRRRMGAAHLLTVRSTILTAIASRPKLKAVRHVLQDEPDDNYMLRDDFNRGIGLLKNGLRYDILIFERHLPQAIQLVDRHPRQMFILDHVAKPESGRTALALARKSPRAGQAAERLLQDFGNGHRGGSSQLDAATVAALF